MTLGLKWKPDQQMVFVDPVIIFAKVKRFK